MYHNSREWRSSIIATKLRKKKHELRDLGLPYVLHKLFRDHIYKHERFYLLQRDLSVALPRVSRRKNDTKTIRFLTGKDDMAGFELFLCDHSRHMRELFDSGVRCAATFVDDMIIAYLWMIPGGLYDQELRYQVCCAQDEILQGVYVHPNYRGSPVLLELLDYGWNYYRQQGYKRVLGMALENNWPSIRMHLRLDFKETGRRLHTHKLTAFRWTKREVYEGQCLRE